MRCPYCGCLEDKVVDSRPTDEGLTIRRRRECVKCAARFTTYEKIETVPLMVVKKDGTRQGYDRNKILGGIVKACEKRPVSMNQIEKLVDSIELSLYNSMKKEVSTEEIGEIIMTELKGLDQVAYVRFASVYRQFKDIDTFMEELTKIMKEK
ncbi:MAG: transcriptional repressor NrdR [Ruminococcaceae bacterium]|nr:transcriptional repressor NrdR [Oscillospiraceae bacterium]